MKSVFEQYHTLWPKESAESLAPMLKRVRVLEYPTERLLLAQANPENTIIVIENVEVREVVGLVEMGFEHCVQKGRDDFAQELLASSLMLLRPESFMKDPIAFFCNGFRKVESPDPELNLILPFHKSSEKGTLLGWLDNFLQQTPHTDSLREMCLHTADNLITNALYNAPIKIGGKRPYQELPRDIEVEIPVAQRATLFACRSEKRVIVGCLDQYGSLDRETLLVHLRSQFKEQTVKLRAGQAGAGLGFRNIIGSAAGIYVLGSKGRLTLVASSFSLKGLRANLSNSKHFHISFR